jgi:hypothetical protein
MGKGGYFPGGTAAAAWSWPLTSNYFQDQEEVDLYTHHPININGVLLNKLGTGSTLTFTDFLNLNNDPVTFITYV